MITKLPPAARVYTWSGRNAHLLRWDDSPSNGRSALCGVHSWPNPWFGTGTQDEHDRAASLPLCKRCEAKVPAVDRPINAEEVGK